MGGKNVKITILERALQMIAPDLCYSCGKIGSLFCAYCKYDIIYDSQSVCFWCGCAAVQGVCSRHAMYVDRVTTVGLYEDGLKRAIEAFKFRNDIFAAATFSDLLSMKAPIFPGDTVVVPVPTLRRNVRRRGYDHALLLARGFAKRRGYIMSQLVERRASFTQHESTSREERQNQVHGAFSLPRSFIPPQSVVIVDDIVTTGSTIQEISKILRDAGVKNIFAVALARVD